MVAQVEVSLTIEGTERTSQQIELRIKPLGTVQPEAIELAVDGTSLPLEPTDSPGISRSRMTLRPGRRTELRLRYTYPLGDGPIVSFSYPLQAAAAWPTANGSARVLLSLPPDLPREAWISTTSSPTSFDGKVVDWHFNQAAPPTQVRLQFVRPDLWAQITHPPAETDTEALISRMEALLALASVDAPHGPAFNRFYPTALAQANQVIQVAPERPEGHLALARLYLLHRDEAGWLPPSYATLAIAEAREAMQAGAPQDQTRSLLEQALRRLVDEAKANGRWEEALDYLEELAKLQPQEQDVKEEREAILIGLAGARLKDGTWSEAAQLLRDAWGVTGLEDLAPPWLQASIARVETTPERRIITVQMYLTPGRQEDAAAQAREAVNGLRSIGEVRANASITEERVELQIVIPLTDDEYFLVWNRALANTLPDRPEWAFLAQLLRPETFHWQSTKSWWRQRISYEEVVDLRPPADVWRSYASQVELKAQEVASRQPDSVASLILALGQTSATSWRELQQHVQVRYMVRLSSTHEPRRWLLQPDERRQLSAQMDVILPWLSRWLP